MEAGYLVTPADTVAHLEATGFVATASMASLQLFDQLKAGRSLESRPQHQKQTSTFRKKSGLDGHGNGGGSYAQPIRLTQYVMPRSR